MATGKNSLSGTVGDTVTVANSDDNGGNALSFVLPSAVGATAKYALMPWSGAATPEIGVEIEVTSGTEGAGYLRADTDGGGGTANRGVVMGTLYLPVARPTGVVQRTEAQIRSTSNVVMATLKWDDATNPNQLVVAQASSVDVATLSTVLENGKKYNYGLAVTRESVDTANDGIIEVIIWDAQWNVVHSQTFTGRNVGVGSPGQYRTGSPAASTEVPRKHFMKDMQWGELASGWFSPIPAPTPTVNAVITADKEVYEAGAPIILTLSGGVTETVTASPTVPLVVDGGVANAVAPYTLDGASITFSHKVESDPTPATVTVTVNPASMKFKTPTGMKPYARRRGRVEAPNVGPTAAFTTTVSNLLVTVDTSTSTDPDGVIVTRTVDWGDGTVGALTGTTGQHTYAAAGTYPLLVTVGDDNGATDSQTGSVTVSVAAVPTPTMVSVTQVTGTQTIRTEAADAGAGYEYLWFETNTPGPTPVATTTSAVRVSGHLSTLRTYTFWVRLRRITDGALSAPSNSMSVDLVAPSAGPDSVDDFPGYTADWDGADLTSAAVTTWTSRTGSLVPTQTTTDRHPTRVTDGTLAPAALFDGLDNLVLDNPAILSGSSGITVYVVMTHNFPTTDTGTHQVLYISTGALANNARFSHRIVGNKLGVAGRRLDTDSNQVFVGNTVLTAGTKYVTTTQLDYAAGQARLFLNGVAEGSTAFQTPGTTSATSPLRLVIGSNGSATPAEYINGRIGKILVYNAVHTTDEVAAVTQMLGGTTPPPPPPTRGAFYSGFFDGGILRQRSSTSGGTDAQKAAYQVQRMVNYGTWRGEAVTTYGDFMTRTLWSTIDGYSTQWTAYGTLPSSTVVQLGIPMLPDDQTTNLRNGAAGAYTQLQPSGARTGTTTPFLNLAREFVRVCPGDGRRVYRLAWEMNVSPRWSILKNVNGGNPSAGEGDVARGIREFNGFWRLIAGDIYSVDPGAIIFWCPIAGYPTTAYPVPEAYYPGDDVVDMVGGDVYDVDPRPGTYDQMTYGNPLPSESVRQTLWNNKWTEIYSGERGYGLKWLQGFAKARNKKLGLGEWANSPLKGTPYTDGGVTKYISNPGGGDNPVWIQKIHAYLQECRNLGIDVYDWKFDVDAHDGDFWLFEQDWGPSPYPRARDQYVALNWSASAT